MADVVIDLSRLTIADYPELTRVVQAVLKNPADPDVAESLIELLDRVVEGGVSHRPAEEFSQIRLAFVKAVAELLRPKVSRLTSGAISGSAEARGRPHSPGSRSS